MSKKSEPTKVETQEKTLDDFKPSYSCRFHPTDWWHEVGCSHREWTIEELQSALNSAKQSNAYLSYKLFELPHPGRQEER